MKRSNILVFALLGTGLLGFGLWLTRSFDPLENPYNIHLAADTLETAESGNLAGYMGRITEPQTWIPSSSQVPGKSSVDVVSGSPEDLLVEFDLAGFYLQQTSVGGRACTRVSLPGCVMLKEAGLPEVPMLAASLVIPASGTPQIEIVKHITREIKVDPVAPSLGHLTRNIDPSRVKPFFADFYESDGVWPAEPLVLGAPFVMRDRRGLTLRLQPLRYDAGRGVLQITDRLLVRIVTNVGDPKTGGGGPAGAPEFEAIFQRNFQNFEAAATAEKYDRLANRGRMLIITDPAFASSLSAFRTWKHQLGIETVLVTTAETGQSAAGIAQTISQYYEDPAGLTWVVLVGDKAQVPTNTGTYDGSDSDSMYGLLSGGDLYPDVFVSRISATNATEVAVQVTKFIAYERDPDTGADAGWYGRALGVASNEGTPTDAERADLLKTDLLGFGFDQVTSLYQGQGGTTAGIAAAVNGGCSLINYLGHGSGTGWYSVVFTRTDVQALTNDGHLPWIIDVSCSNGDFALDECFAESWLRAGSTVSPRGAVAMMSATSLTSWVPPTIMQSEAVDLLANDQAHTLGELLYSGLMKMLDTYGGLSVATRTLEQYVIFGDCSLMVRSQAPSQFGVTAPDTIAEQVGSFTVTVAGPTGAVVTVVADGELYGAGVVDQNGLAEVVLTRQLEGIETLALTVSGYNMVPTFTTIAVGSGGGPDTTPATDPEATDLLDRVVLRGNYPNPFNPATRIAFDLPRSMQVRLSVYDIRGRLINTLANRVMESGRQEITWNGRDTSDREQASGVYLYHLTTADGNQIGRMTLTR